MKATLATVYLLVGTGSMAQAQSQVGFVPSTDQNPYLMTTLLFPTSRFRSFMTAPSALLVKS